MIAKKMIRAVGVVLALAAFCVPQSYATVPTCPEESLLGHPASTASNNSALDAAASDLWPWPAPGYSDDPTVAFKSYTDAVQFRIDGDNHGLLSGSTKGRDQDCHQQGYDSYDYQYLN